MLRGVFGPNREEVTGERRKLHGEKLHDFGPLVVTDVKSRRFRWAEQVSSMRRSESATRFLFKNPK